MLPEPSIVGSVFKSFRLTNGEELGKFHVLFGCTPKFKIVFAGTGYRIKLSDTIFPVGVWQVVEHSVMS